MLRRDDNSILSVTLDLKVSGKRMQGRPKITWKKQLEENTQKIGLKKEHALNRLSRERDCKQLQKEWR